MTLSRIGLTLALLYAAVSAFLIFSQGLFGESFVVLLLGFPWSFIPAFFEFGNVTGAMLYLLVFAPLVLNTLILYWIGSLIERP
jgi:hypothetical protein